jgi:hypothetical protein
MRLAQGGLGTEVVAQLGFLDRLGVLYATGNLREVILSAVHGHACLAKPYNFAQLLRGLEIVTEMVNSGTASLPFPRGFQVLPNAPPFAPAGA